MGTLCHNDKGSPARDKLSESNDFIIMAWERAVFLVLSTLIYVMNCKALFLEEKVNTSTTFYKAIVNASMEVSDLKHFWKSTGFCPPDPHEDFYKFMSTNDMAQNIAYIGSVPNRGIEQVRIHWLLDLMSLSDDGAKVKYSFTYLDKAMDLLLSNGLRPGFELMGNPSNYFTNFDDQREIYAWRDLIKALGIHLIEQYGLEEVSQWNFESWNEPQNKLHFDGVKVSLQGYLNYYDACSEGLCLAHPALKLGGPGSGDPETHPIFYSLLDHCYNGINFFTGEKGVRLDFISFHIKGQGHSNTILDTERRVLTMIEQHFPKFVGIPVYNDEADPLVGWSREEEWRTDARYAAMVVKIITQHQNLLIPVLKMKYSLLSNDNGFMGYPPSVFSQRTLLARFQMNTSHPRKAEFIKKPVLSVMGLLSILGDRQVFAEVSMATGCFARNDDLGLIATTVHDQRSQYNNWELAVIVYNSNDTTNLTGLAVVNLSISGIPVVKEVLYVMYKIDNDHGNPYGTWKKMKSPVFPTEKQFRELRLNQEPVRVTGPVPLPSEAHPGTFASRLEVALPGVALMHFCVKPLFPPSKVENVSLLTVSSNEVLVSWNHSGCRCIKTYQVLYSSTSEAGPYEVMNHVDIIFWAYHVVVEKDDRLTTHKGWFKVHAVDYWNRIGRESKPVKWSYPGEESGLAT